MDVCIVMILYVYVDFVNKILKYFFVYFCEIFFGIFNWFGGYGFNNFEFIFFEDCCIIIIYNVGLLFWEDFLVC